MKVIVINKKYRIIAGLVIIMLCGISSFFRDEKHILVNVTPATNRIVVLDAGHGVPEDGICLSYFLRM